jgi:DNA-binding CsgD family transcriptional regulator
MGNKPATYALTVREKQIALLLLNGHKRSAMASDLGIHLRTVDYHLANLRRKVMAGSLVELAVRMERLNGALSKGHA